MNPIGIMQGRLSPPTNGRIQSFPADTWQDEFFLARDLGLDCVEWLFDAVSREDNPLLSEAGIIEIDDIRKRSGIEIWSVCADYFRDYPLIRVDAETLGKRLEILQQLILKCRVGGIARIMIPFVDSAAIVSEEDLEQAVFALERVLPFAQTHEVAVAVETSLEPKTYKSLLQSIGHSSLRVTYDTGDCASLGHDPADEIELLGPWLETVHVKDRPRGGVTVPLGTGSADFNAAFAALASFKYKGALILQCARERAGNEVETVIRNMEFVQNRLRRACQMTGRECCETARGQ